MFGGGAVYEEHQHAQSYCGFFRLLDPGGSFQNPFIHLRFQDNEAQETGDDVYASLDCAYKFDPSEIPYYYVHNRTNTDILRALASPSNIDIAADPLIVCYTYEGAPQQCSHNQTSPEQMTLYPGQSKMLIILTLDEYGGTTPSVVFFVDGDGQYYDTWRTGTSYSYPLGYELSNNISLRIIPQALFRVDQIGIESLRLGKKLKPFIDSYEGPYVNRHRFWTGILLLARAIIYSVNTNVQLTSKSTDLMVVISITVGLMVYLARFGVYKKWQYTLLEMFLCADLSLLCLIALSFESYEENGSSALSLSSLHSAYAVLVGIAFICFLAVLGIQTYLFVKRLRTKQGAEHQPKQPQEYMMLDVISKPARSLEVSATEYEPRYLRESLMEASSINRSEHS
eukprot:Em0006g1481a